MVPISTIQRATTITRIKTGDILCDVDEMSLSPLRANLKKRWDLFTVSFYGDIGTGKTALRQAICSEQRGLVTEPTLGYEVVERTIRGGWVRFCDTSGEERWQSSLPWIPKGDLAIVVFSVHSQSSWLNVPKWIENVRTWHGQNVPIVVVATQLNPTKRRAISKRRSSLSCMLESLTYIEVTNLDDVETLIDLIEHFRDNSHQRALLQYDQFTSSPSPKRAQCWCT